MQSIFARGVYLGENTSQSASVEFVRFQRTNYARGRLQAFCPKRALPFWDSLKNAPRPGRIFQASFRSMITWHAVRSVSSTYAASSSDRVTFSG